MVLRAIELGYESIGFSGHSYTDFDNDCNMTEEGTFLYRKEICLLREKYAHKIQIYLGIEQDIMSPRTDFEYDFVIGSVHYMKIGDEVLSVDYTSAIAEDAVERHFSGDWLAYVEEYYAIAKDTAGMTGCDIVGHFDLVTKFNEGGRYFDETSIRYRTAAIDALRYEINHCNLFEINTGAIYRKMRSVPYPADFLVRELNRLGGEVILSSDSHDAASLGYLFRDAAEFAVSCGFKYAKVLRNGKFTDVKL